MASSTQAMCHDQCDAGRIVQLLRTAVDSLFLEENYRLSRIRRVRQRASDDLYLWLQRIRLFVTDKLPQIVVLNPRSYSRFEDGQADGLHPGLPQDFHAGEVPNTHSAAG
jgi:hypothetical protein